MITQRTITYNGEEILVNVSDLKSPWVMIHDGSKVLRTYESSGVGQLETKHTIFEAASKEACEAEATKLGLTGFEDSLDKVQANPSVPPQVSPPEPPVRDNVVPGRARRGGR